ncbi:MAG: hypothetical protein V1758_02685, partial [Pseudomonadota bacterium]
MLPLMTVGMQAEKREVRVTGYPLFVLFFMAGVIVFFVGLAMRLLLYWRGEWDPRALLKGIFLTLFSVRIVKLLGVLFLDGVFQRKLFSQDKLRWLMKVLIMVGYPGILIAGHLKVERMPQFENIPQW